MNRQDKKRWYAFAPLALAAVLLVASLGYGPPLGGKGSSLRWYNFSEGLDAAKKANKKVLLDVYTDWCGWCKKMDAEVYTDAAVMRYLNEKYILVKMNAESAAKVQYAGEELSELELSAEFGVTGFPTTIFLLPNGDPITMLPGYVEANQFLDVLTYIGDDYYEKMKYEEFLAKQNSK